MRHSEEVIQTIENYCMSKPAAYESRPFGTYPICYRIMGKIFAQLNPESHFYKMTLKCRPEQAQVYRQLYPGVVVRGYHCPPIQQPHWNTIDLDVFNDIEVLYQMIDEAYDAVVEKLTRKARAQLLRLAELEFSETDGEDDDFAMLCGKLDQALDELAGGVCQRAQYVQYNHRDNIHDVIVVYLNGKPVGCGSFKMYDEEHAELKRMFTEPSCRGIGLGSEIIRRLEAKAKIKGYRWCILETGKPLEAACHLYAKAGYQVIDNYGQYVDMPASICMQHKI